MPAEEEALKEQTAQEIAAETEAINKLALAQEELNNARASQTGGAPIPMSITKGSFEKVTKHQLPEALMEFEDGGNIEYKATLTVTCNDESTKVDAYYDDSGNLKAVVLPANLSPTEIKGDKDVEALGNFMKAIGKPYGKISPKQEFTDTQLTGLILAMKYAGADTSDTDRMFKSLEGHKVGGKDVTPKMIEAVHAASEENPGLKHCTSHLHPPQPPLASAVQGQSGAEGSLVDGNAQSPDTTQRPSKK